MANARAAGVTGQIMVRADSGYYSRAVIVAAQRSGDLFSIGAKLNRGVLARITQIPETNWNPIPDYPGWTDPETGELVAGAELAEIDYAPFGASENWRAGAIPLRLVVRRIPIKPHHRAGAAQQELFPRWRYHAFVTNSALPTAQADATHRDHAIIESTIAALKDSALAHLPSARFHANSAWLTAAITAHNLTRAMGVLAAGKLTRAEPATIRDRLIKTPARIARSGRQLTLHLPRNWPWKHNWTTAWNILRT